MFEFVSLLEKAREKSIYMRRQAADEADESLRAYIPPPFPVNSSYIFYVYISYIYHAYWVKFRYIC